MIKINLKSIVFTLIIVSLLSLFVTSCSDNIIDTDHKFNTGHSLSDEISRLEEELIDKETADADTIITDITESTVFYWTLSGSKIHLFDTCQSLSKSDPESIKTGSLEDAYRDRKTEPCSFCLKKANLTEEDFPIFEPSTEETTGEDSMEPVDSKTEITESTVFYWTASGSKIHLFNTCQSLSKSDPENIKTGSLEDAYHDKKTEPCSFCLKKANLTEDDFPTFDQTTETSEMPTDASSSDSSEDTFPNDETIYIWTKNGTKLHLYENCSYLSKTSEENKIRGNKGAATEYGISEICSRCQKNSQNTD